MNLPLLHFQCLQKQIVFRSVFKYLVRFTACFTDVCQSSAWSLIAAVIRCCIQAGGNQLLVVEQVMNGLEGSETQSSTSPVSLHPSSYLPSVALNLLAVCVLLIDYLIPPFPPSLCLLCCFASSPLLRLKWCEHQVCVEGGVWMTHPSPALLLGE